MERGIIIAFLQVKGGVGKSTLSQNLAVAFAHDNIKVKIIDCDIRQRTCSKWVARRNDYHPNKPKVLENTQNERLKICETCPKFIKLTKTCKECGCFMVLKTKLSEASCPLGKW